MSKTSRPVEMICVCGTDGQLRPLRLRTQEDSRELRIDICEILGVEREQRFGAESVTFLCRGHTGESRYLLELCYHVRSHCWSIIRCFQS